MYNVVRLFKLSCSGLSLQQKLETCSSRYEGQYSDPEGRPDVEASHLIDYLDLRRINTIDGNVSGCFL